MILLFLLTLWLGSYLTKDFWGKTAAKVVTVINILIAIPVILNIKNVDFLTSIALSIGYAAVFVALNVLIALLIVAYDSIFGGSSSDTTQEETKKEPPPPPPSEEEQAKIQRKFSLYEKYSLDVTGKVKNGDPFVEEDTECLKYMISTGKLKSKNGNSLTSEMVQKIDLHRDITDKCIELGLNPKSKDDRESAEYLVKADKYDEEDDYDYDDDDEDDDYEDDNTYHRGHHEDDDDEEEERPSRGSSYSNYTAPESFHYQMQYKRSGSGTWMNSSSYPSEWIAESSFDNFVNRQTSSNGANQNFRLVKKDKFGKVVSVLRSC